MHIIKQKPEDFVVKEINELEFYDNGGYSYYELKKVNYNTLDAIKKIANTWKIRDKFINFAGTKDKVAVTKQYISIKNGPKKSLKLKNIELKFLGRGKERLNLGCLQGNSFEIVVRNITKLPKKKSLFVNYFDSQRFGKNMDNHIVGKFILKKEYDKACLLIDDTKNYLKDNPADFVGALRSIPKKILKLYIHAYQSHLWNMAAEEIKEMIKENIEIPLVGFGTEFKDKKVKAIYKTILDTQNITLRDFVNKTMPEVCEEGSTRKLYAELNDLTIGKLENDDLNKDQKKVLIKFSLPKGAYATNVIKGLFE